MIRLPYFDLLLEARRQGRPEAKAFENFVHWGYWEDPAQADGRIPDFVNAMDRLNDRVLESAALSDGQDVLDAGCGFGGTLASIDKRFSRMRLIGVNIDPRQLEVARSQITPRSGNTLSFREGNACQLALPDASFDRVLAVECIFHFPSRLAFLKEGARVLRPGGILALSDFVPLFIGGSTSWVGRWLEGQISRGYGDVGTGFSEGDYRSMAQEAGLEVERDEDITRQTIPTYPVIRELIFGKLDRGGKDLLWSTRLLEWLSRLRIVQYRVLRFRKP